MIGSEKGASASGYNTTYDVSEIHEMNIHTFSCLSTLTFFCSHHCPSTQRVRVISAMAVAEIPLYNYNPGIGEEKNLGSKWNAGDEHR